MALYRAELSYALMISDAVICYPEINKKQPKFGIVFLGQKLKKKFTALTHEALKRKPITYTIIQNWLLEDSYRFQD